MTNFRIVEDPRIAQVAKICHDEMLAEIGKRMATGEDFFHARETVMAERGNDIARTYGKDVATRALQALKALDPRDLPYEILFRQDQVIADARIHAANYVHGGEHYWTRAQLWKQRNFDRFFDLMKAGATVFVTSPIIGAAGALVFGGISHWWPFTVWTAMLGLSVFPILFFATCFISDNPTRVPGTAPGDAEELMRQRSAIDARQHEEFLQRLAQEEEHERTMKREARAEREHLESLKRIARDKEIDGIQERRRLGTSLPDDPIYIPPVRRPYRRRQSR